MLTSERRAFLLDRLARDGRIVATTLAAELDTSEDTIRRDLRELAAEGLLLRVHGGALPASPAVQPLAARRSISADLKARLSARAAKLLRPGLIVTIDGGTTHTALVQALPRDLQITVVTHSPSIAAQLEPFMQIEVIMIGGSLLRHSMVTVGTDASDAYSRIRSDLCLLGVTGIHAEAGLTTGNLEEAAIKRRMIAQAAEAVVIATPDKLGAVSSFVIAPLSAIDTIVIADERDYDFGSWSGETLRA
ncbi:DeoR/GlpR transcriptional regulator [bacterium]|nr:MAG: DeoR/GlpR transcriptional regulator [bacterium]